MSVYKRTYTVKGVTRTAQHYTIKFTAPDITAIFFVARKKPPAPDLPMSNRDIANKIDEARNLAQHIPSCIKGK